jgi:myo-inositol-1(or 4)-monophosphatase
VTAADILIGRWNERSAGLRTKTTSTDIVLDADSAAEDAAVGIIRSAYPNDAVLAEESAASKGTTERIWYVDPLDGTVNYFYGIPHFACAIACEDAAGLLAAAVLDVWKRELFSAVRGRGAWIFREEEFLRRDPAISFEIFSDAWEPEWGQPLRIRNAEDLSSSLVATGFAYVAEARAEQARILDAVLPKVRDIRRFGSAQLDLAWTASGRFDAYFESVDKPWDWKAGALLVQEAGGRVTEMPQARPGQPHIVASAPRIHEALVALLRDAVQRA